MSLFATDKEELIKFVLDKYDVHYKPNHNGWQKVSCFNEAGHIKGDRNPSGSVNLGFGYYRCFSCDLSGDGYTILRFMEGWDVKQVNEAFGGEVLEHNERTWL